MAQQLFWSVVSLAVAVGAFLVVDARRKARTVARTVARTWRALHRPRPGWMGHERAASVTRRQFVLISGAVGGALVLGVALRRRQQVVQGGAPARGTLNAYVRIEPDGVSRA